MRTRKLGVTELDLTVVGLGAAGIGGGPHPSQMAETASGGDWVLSPEDVAEIDALVGQLLGTKEG